MRKVIEVDPEYANVVGEVNVKEKESKVKLFKKIAIGVGAAAAAVLAGLAGAAIVRKRDDDEATAEDILSNQDNDDILDTDYEEVEESEIVEENVD